MDAIVNAHPQRDGRNGYRDDVERGPAHVHQTVEPNDDEENRHERDDRLLGRTEPDGQRTQNKHRAENEGGLHFVLHGGGGREPGDGSAREHDPRQRLVLFLFTRRLVRAAGEVREHLKVAPHLGDTALHAGEILGLGHAESDLHHVVGGIITVDVQPGLVRVEFNHRHDVELDDAGGDVGNGADPWHAVQREETVEEGQALPVGRVHQRAVAGE